MKALPLILLAGITCCFALGADPVTLTFSGGSQTDLQALFDKAPERATVVCKQQQPLVISESLTIAKPMTLRGLKANLPPKLGKTPILSVDAEGVTLTDIEMHGNYDSVKQDQRSPFIHIKRGNFRVERCKFFDGTKDGLMVTPDHGTGDLVRGVIRDIEGFRMGRDVVSLSGGNRGQRICNVTVENVRIQKGYYRGAVEVSDGTDNITVRHVYAENALYAIDVQDHQKQFQKAVGAGQQKPCAPNTNVTLEDVEAVSCTHVIRTANSPLKHANLSLHNFTARNCKDPVQISNTTHVRIENLTIRNEPPAEHPRIALRNCDDVLLRNVVIEGLKPGIQPLQISDSKNVKVDRLTRDGKEEEP